MKKFALIITLLFSSNLWAEAPKGVEAVRKDYKEAQKSADYSISINRDRNYCAIGPANKKVEIIFDGNKKPKLIKESFNKSGQKFYREYLIKNDNLLFFYQNDNTHDGKVEKRIYFLDTLYTLPENLEISSQEIKEIKETAKNYLNLAKKVSNYKSEAEEFEKIEPYLIKEEEAKNNHEILAIDKRKNNLEELIKNSEEEIHLKSQTTILIKDKKDKKEFKFYYSPDEECGNPAISKLNLVKILKTDNDGGVEFGEEFLFNEKQNLIKNVNWESIEGSEGSLYFLNKDKIYCLGDIRVMKEDGTMEQFTIACNSPKKEKGMFFDINNYGAKKDSKKVLEIFNSFSNLELY